MLVRDSNKAKNVMGLWQIQFQFFVFAIEKGNLLKNKINDGNNRLLLLSQLYVIYFFAQYYLANIISIVVIQTQNTSDIYNVIRDLLSYNLQKNKNKTVIIS